MQGTQNITDMQDPVLQQFTYPDAKKISENTYSSHDDPQIILQWYKSRFSQFKFSIQTALVSHMNDSIKYTLISTKEKRTVSVIISKEKSQRETNIQLSIK